MSRASRSTTDQVNDSFVLLLAIGLGLLVAFGVWAAHLVWTAFARQPRNKALWIALLVWLGSLLALVLAVLTTQGSGDSSLVGVAGAVVGIATVFLLIVCRSVSASSQHLFSQPKETLTARVLRKPWWPRSDEAA